jgi:hypothetical protein
MNIKNESIYTTTFSWLNGLLSSSGTDRMLPKNREKEGNKKEKEGLISTPKTTVATLASARKKQHKDYTYFSNILLKGSVHAYVFLCAFILLKFQSRLIRTYVRSVLPYLYKSANFIKEVNF